MLWHNPKSPAHLLVHVATAGVYKSTAAEILNSSVHVNESMSQRDLHEVVRFQAAGTGEDVVPEAS